MVHVAAANQPAEEAHESGTVVASDCGMGLYIRVGVASSAPCSPRKLNNEAGGVMQGDQFAPFAGKI
jgi:hypothetical protein